jgi:hypothetical protein
MAKMKEGEVAFFFFFWFFFSLVTCRVARSTVKLLDELRLARFARRTCMYNRYKRRQEG